MIEIWIVDDVARHRDEVALVINKIDSAKLLQFEKAQDALYELIHRTNNNLALPKIIILDRNLEADSPPYNIGEFVVGKIKSNPKLKNIVVVAHSSIKKCNDDMLAAGADIAFSKNNQEEIKRFITDTINQ